MQLALTYDAAHQGAEDWQLELGWCRRAVEVLGHKFVAGELDIAPSTLTDALLERERKSFKGEWIAKLRRLVSESMLEEYFRLVSRPHGFECRRVPTMTPEQELKLLREHLERRAPVALETFDKGLGR